MHVCVFVSICLCVCVRLCFLVFMCLFVWVCMYACVYARVRACMSVCAHTHDPHCHGGSRDSLIELGALNVSVCQTVCLVAKTLQHDTTQ